MSATIYPPLTAYRIHRDDGTSYVTSMAAGVTLEQARAYFIGQTEFDDTETIRFIRSTVIAVTPCAGTPHSRIEREIALAQSERTARSIHRQACELHRLNTPPKEGDIINDPTNTDSIHFESLLLTPVRPGRIVVAAATNYARRNPWRG